MAAPTLLTVTGKLCKKEKQRPPPLEDVEDDLEPTFWAPSPQSPDHVAAGAAAAAAFLARVANAAPEPSNVKAVEAEMRSMWLKMLDLQAGHDTDYNLLKQEFREIKMDMHHFKTSILELEAFKLELDTMKEEIARVRSSGAVIDSIKMDMDNLLTSKLKIEAFKPELDIMKQDVAGVVSSIAEIESIKTEMQHFKTSRLDIEAFKPELEIAQQEIARVRSSSAEMINSIKMDMKACRSELEAGMPELEVMRQEIAGLRSSSACIDAITADMRHLRSLTSDMEAKLACHGSELEKIAPILKELQSYQPVVDIIKLDVSELKVRQGDVEAISAMLATMESDMTSRREPGAISNGQGRSRRGTVRSHFTKTMDLLDFEPAFNVQRRVRGPKCKNLHQIQTHTRSSLWVIDKPGEALRLEIGADSQADLNEAVKQARHLLKSVRRDYQDWLRQPRSHGQHPTSERPRANRVSARAQRPGMRVGVPS